MNKYKKIYENKLKNTRLEANKRKNNYYSIIINMILESKETKLSSDILIVEYSSIMIIIEGFEESNCELKIKVEINGCTEERFIFKRKFDKSKFDYIFDLYYKLKLEKDQVYFEAEKIKYKQKLIELIKSDSSVKKIIRKIKLNLFL